MGDRYISEAGAYVYFFTSERDLDFGLIGLSEFLDRLSYLGSMADPGSELSRHLAERLADFGLEAHPKSWDSPDKEEKITLPRTVEGVHADTTAATSRETQPMPPNLPPLSFLTSAAGILGAKWLFRKGDPDWFPSIPHGHLLRRDKIKLDAYRGYTFDTRHANAPLKREPRAYVINLWNTEAFRIFAADALRHFIANNDDFEWRLQRGISRRRALLIPKRR